MMIKGDTYGMPLGPFGAKQSPFVVVPGGGHVEQCAGGSLVTTAPKSTGMKKEKTVQFQEEVSCVPFDRRDPPCGLMGEWYSYKAVADTECHYYDGLETLVQESDRFFSFHGLGITMLDKVFGQIVIYSDCVEKNLSVRLSTDNWASFTDIEAVYITKGCTGKFPFKPVDHFEFELDSSCLDFKGDAPRTISLAVKCVIGGMEHWDNNHGSNYNYQLFACRQSPQPSFAEPLKTAAVQEEKPSQPKSVFSNYFLPSTLVNVNDNFVWSFT